MTIFSKNTFSSWGIKRRFKDLKVLWIYHSLKTCIITYILSLIWTMRNNIWTWVYKVKFKGQMTAWHVPSRFKVILHQFWVKKFFPWKFYLEYGGTFTKLFMHVSSRNMFPTIRNLQIRVHVYRPHHCCGDWLTFGCFVPMIADHDLMTKR